MSVVYTELQIDKRQDRRIKDEKIKRRKDTSGNSKQRCFRCVICRVTVLGRVGAGQFPL